MAGLTFSKGSDQVTTKSVALLCVTGAVVLMGLAMPTPAAGQGEGYREQPDAAGCPGYPAPFYPCAKEKAKAFEPPRTPDGHPDLQGFWATGRQSMYVEDHPPSMGIRGETSIIVDPPDGKFPNQPWAEARRAEIFELNQNPPSVEYLDPPGRCFLKGIPRQLYNNPFPIQFIQNADYVILLHEQNHAYQIIPLDDRPHVGEDIKMWMGDSRGHWEGDTLVVESTNHNGRGWLDLRANFYSDAARVVERYTLIDPDVLLFEAEIDDPTVFTRPFTVAFPLRRNTTEGLQLMEFACHEGNRSPAIQLGGF
jgi:hypothetical protein